MLQAVSLYNNAVAVSILAFSQCTTEVQMTLFLVSKTLFMLSLAGISDPDPAWWCTLRFT